MKCKQCSNRIRVNFGGYCSTSCRDYKPAPKPKGFFMPQDEKIVYVNAGDDFDMPVHYEIEDAEAKELDKAHKDKTNKHWKRESLKREFSELQGLK